MSYYESERDELWSEWDKDESERDQDESERDQDESELEQLRRQLIYIRERLHDIRRKEYRNESERDEDESELHELECVLEWELKWHEIKSEWDDADESERKRLLWSIECIRELLHDIRRKEYRNNDPSKKDLKLLADSLHSKIAETNSSPNLRHDAKQDTTAVGLSLSRRGKAKLVITANTKERRETDSMDKNNYVKVRIPEGGRQKVTYDDYGITEPLSKMILSEVRQSDVYRKGGMDVEVVEERHNPKNNPHLPTMLDKAKDHASKHAESKMQAAEGKRLRKIAISKEPCEGCHADLRRHDAAMMPDTPGTNRVTNRRAVDREEVTVRNKIDRSKEYEMKLSSYKTIDNNFKLSGTQAKTSIRGSVKPGASVGLISGAAQLVTSIKDGNFEPYADGGARNADAGVVQNILGGKTYYARTSALQGRVGFGDLASIGASALSAGAHAEYGWNNSVGVNASLVRVDGNLGPVQAGVGLNFDTHASVGVNGVSASVLGMGVSVGPRLGIQTPLCNLSFTPF